MSGARRLPEGLRREYDAAVYEAELPGGLVIFRVGSAPAGIPPTGALAIVTAFNPGRARPGEALNLGANRRLAAAIERLGYDHRPALGRSADGSHFEPSFAVPDIPATEAVALGRNFSQAAIFYWDGAEARILSCTD